MNITRYLRCSQYTTSLQKVNRKTDMKTLTSLCGAPEEIMKSFYDITNETEMVLSDRQVAFFLNDIYDKYNRCKKPDPLGAIPTALQLYETAELVGHLVGQHTTFSMMKICWEANREDTRELLIFVFKRLLAKNVWGNSRVKNDSKQGVALIMEMYKMTLKAAMRKHGMATADLEILLESMRGMKMTPEVLSLTYAMWKKVNPQMADKAYSESLKSTPSMTIENFHVFISHSGSFEIGLSMLRDMTKFSLKPSLQTYNSILIGSLNQKNIPFIKNKIDKLLTRMQNAGIHPDGNTLGLVSALYRRHQLGDEAYTMYKHLKQQYNIIPDRTSLTSIIAAQVSLCDVPDCKSIRNAEEVYLEILRRDLAHQKPHDTAFHHIGHIMQCYATAGDLTKLELTRDYYSRLVPNSASNTSSRVTKMISDAYLEIYRTLERRAEIENPSWGGNLHEPWKIADDESTTVPEHMNIWP